MLRNFWRPQLPSITFFAPATSYHQDELLKKLNLYLSKHNKKLTLGYCHGLTLLWLKKMALKQEQQFYTLIQTIINCPDAHITTLGLEIEKLAKSIDKKQNPENYSRNKIQQFNIDKILRTKKQTILDGEYNVENLAQLIFTKCQNGDMLCISSDSFSLDGPSTAHTIGVYLRNFDYHLYDPNDKSGVAQVLCSEDTVANEIFKRLYTAFDYQPAEQYIIEIKCVRYPVGKLATKMNSIPKPHGGNPSTPLRKRFISTYQCDRLGKKSCRVK